MDDKYGSRKFIFAVASFLAVTAFAGWGVLKLAADAKDIALLIGAWGTVDTVILGLYNYANNTAQKTFNAANN